MVKILLIGKTGQLGWELQNTLSTLGHLTALDYPVIDLVQPDSITCWVRKVRPEIIVNASAYTAVDQAETERDLAWKVNATAPGILAEEAHRIGALLIHYSTDYVFDGKKGCVYTEQDLPNPINVYGLSKLAGENHVQQVGGAFVILRTSWVYSRRLNAGFVNKVLTWARQQPTLHIVSDQIGSPTWSHMLAEVTAQMLAHVVVNRHVEWPQERNGLYHVAGDGYASRLDWAKAILALDPQRDEQKTQELLPARSIDFKTCAQRPLFSALSCEKFKDTFGIYLPDWMDSLRMAME